jgi:molybdate transport system substrate-binding protein
VAIAALAFGRHSDAGVLRVAVAANFADVARDLADDYAKAHGGRVELSVGSTGKLTAQIENGAPFHVFLSADEARPADLEARGLAVKGSRFTYAVGRLALYGPGLAHPDDGTLDLRAGHFEHLAIANPETAPYGRAARETLEALGLWRALGPRAARGENIAQAFQFVESGAAELGFVALSSVGRGAQHHYWVVPESNHAPIRQDAVLLSAGEKLDAARGFLEFLRSASARRRIERAGYVTEGS